MQCKKYMVDSGPDIEATISDVIWKLGIKCPAIIPNGNLTIISGRCGWFGKYPVRVYVYETAAPILDHLSA